MAEPDKSQHWFNTIPGVLTAIGTIITAATGLIIALNQGPKDPGYDPGRHEPNRKLEEADQKNRLSSVLDLSKTNDWELDFILRQLSTNFEDMLGAGWINKGAEKDIDTTLRYRGCAPKYGGSIGHDLERQRVTLGCTLLEHDALAVLKHLQGGARQLLSSLPESEWIIKKTDKFEPWTTIITAEHSSRVLLIEVLLVPLEGGTFRTDLTFIHKYGRRKAS